MQLEVGNILEGKVTGITKFGAFVELEPGTVGMVHISEVSNTYVNDIAEILKNGQTVSVKVLAVGDDKKISLSIKRALPQQDRPQGGNFRRPQGGGNANNHDGAKPAFNRSQGQGRPPQGQGQGRPPQGQGQGRPQQGGSRPQQGRPQQGGSRPASSSNNNQRFNGTPQPAMPKGSASFEDMLSKFMVNSDEKISGLKKDHTVNRRAGSKRK